MFMLAMVLSGNASAYSQSVAQQIKITATILPARHVIVNDDDQIIKIISNTSATNVSPTVYRNELSSYNVIEPTQKITSDAAKLLSIKIIKPGVLFDAKIDNNYVSSSGIFNLKSPNNTVNLVSTISK